MRRVLILLATLPSLVVARGALTGYCTQGGQVVQTNTISSTTKVMQSYPQCTVTVYYPGGPSGSVTTSGTSVTWTGGQLFNANSGWAGLPIIINGVTYTISSVPTQTSITLTSSAGVQASPVIYQMAATAPAAIYSDNSGTPATNPFASSKSGLWQFFADNGQFNIQLSSGGIPAPFTWSNQTIIDPATLPGIITPEQYGARCNRASDDTASVLAAFNAAVGQRAVLSVSGLCAVTSVLVTAGSSDVKVQMQTGSGFIRHSSALQAASHLIEVTTTGNISITGPGLIDMRGDGSAANNTKNALYIHGSVTGTGPSSALFSDFTIQGAQNVGLQCVDCSNTREINVHSHNNYWFGRSYTGGGGSAGTGPGATYTTNFSSTGGSCDDEPIGLGLNFFIRGITITGFQGNKCELALVQMPDAQANIVGVEIKGYSTWGKGTAGGGGGIFFEGVSNATAQAKIYAPFGKGFECTGSTLIIAPGPTIPLPCSGINAKIDVDGASTSFGVQMSGGATSSAISSCTNANPVVCTATYSPRTGDLVTLSGFTGGWTALNTRLSATNISSTTFSVPINSSGFGAFSASSPNWIQYGVNNMISGGSITNSLACGSMVTTVGGYISGTNCDTTQTGGWALAGWIGGAFTGNRLHNVGIAANSTYPGVVIDAPSKDLTLNDNTIQNDPSGNAMLRGIIDNVENGGTASNTVAYNNIITGATVPYTPVGVPAVGTFPAGALRQAFPTTTGSPLGYLNTAAAGSAWRITETLGNAGTPSVEPGSCGTGSPGVIAGGTNNRFTVSTGGGGTTTCRVNFSQAFSGAPACTFGGNTSSFVYWTTLDTAKIILQGTASIASSFVTVECK